MSLEPSYALGLGTIAIGQRRAKNLSEYSRGVWRDLVAESLVYLSTQFLHVSHTKVNHCGFQILVP